MSMTGFWEVLDPHAWRSLRREMIGMCARYPAKALVEACSYDGEFHAEVLAKSLASRLGSQSLAALVRALAEAHNATLVQEAKDRQAREEWDREESSVVYLMQASPSGQLKVGTSVNVERRRRQHEGSREGANTVTLVSTFPGSYEEEGKTLAAIKALGIEPVGQSKEWFAFDQRIVSLFPAREPRWGRGKDGEA